MLKYKLTEEVLYMKENFISSFDEKNYLLSTYFIIKDNVLFRTKNFNFEDNLSNCYYIKKGTIIDGVGKISNGYIIDYEIRKSSSI